jgi:hypothetical protein
MDNDLYRAVYSALTERQERDRDHASVDLLLLADKNGALHDLAHITETIFGSKKHVSDLLPIECEMIKSLLIRRIEICGASLRAA